MQNNLKTIIVIALISICQNLNLRAAQWHEKPGDQKPILFDVNDSVIPNDNIPLIKPWKTVVCIYKNQSALKPKQKTPLGMGVNYTLY